MDRGRVLVENGPGVGTFTREILRRMRPDAILIAIELNTEFVEYLGEQIRDPRFRVVHGPAERVRSILTGRKSAAGGLHHLWFALSQHDGLAAPGDSRRVADGPEV